VKKPQRSKKSGRTTYTVSTDKHQESKKGPSARREQRKASSGSEESQDSPMRKTYISLSPFFFFFCKNQNPAKFGLARANPAKSTNKMARSGLARPIPGVWAADWSDSWQGAS
jgi:hypothetical protein